MRSAEQSAPTSREVQSSCAVEPVGFVSVIIPNLDGAALLQACLCSLARQDAHLEVILVDNGSTDDSIALAKSMWPGIRVIANGGNLGYSEACSQGASVASAEHLLFLNNDVELGEGTLAVLLQTLHDHPCVGACQPTIRSPMGHLDSAGSYFTRTGFLHHVTEEELAKEGMFNPRFALKGACLLTRRRAYTDAGGFDPSYFAYFEETDLCWRMQLAGWKLLHVASTEVTHGGGRTTQRMFASHYIDYLSFRNRITTLRKNTGPRLRYRVLPVHAALCLVIGAVFLSRGKSRNAMAVVRALLWQLTHTAVVREGQRGTRSIRRDSDRCIDEVTIRTRWASSLVNLRGYLVRWEKTSPPRIRRNGDNLQR